MRSICLFVLTLACVHLNASSARCEVDASAFLQDYDSGDDVGRQILRAYLLGLESGFGWAGTYFIQKRNQPPMICPPRGTIFSAQQLLDVLRKEVTEHPNSGKAHTGLALSIALRRAYPCISGS